MLERRSFLGMAAGAAVLAATPLRAAERLAVVATTGMIADAARVVGGDLVTVRGLMGPGVDPHSYRQTRSDIAAMARADLVLWHGLRLEAQLVEFMAGLGRRRPVVAVAEALPRDRLIAHPEYPGQFDPHVWMDPALWSEVIVAVRDALGSAMPQGRAQFAANAAAYRAEAAALRDYAAAVLQTVPAPARVLVTAHDAFGYFGRAFGFEVEGIQGISTESEAGLARMAELVELIVTRGIRAVFVETSVSDRNIRALIEGAAARGHRVAIGGALFSDAMGPPGSYEGTWLGMIDHNVTTIARALGGDAPATGRLGRLSAAGG
ncbi:MAG: manganese transporter [Alphaproteobacteria bacterium]|nr:MAG: manganese transporter [Alphaproteobacteria bacterium]